MTREQLMLANIDFTLRRIARAIEKRRERERITPAHVAYLHEFDAYLHAQGTPLAPDARARMRGGFDAVMADAGITPSGIQRRRRIVK